MSAAVITWIIRLARDINIVTELNWTEPSHTSPSQYSVLMITRTVFMVQPSYQCRCESSLGSFKEWRKVSLTFEQSWSTWALKAACVYTHHCHFIIIQPKSWYSLTLTLNLMNTLAAKSWMYQYTCTVNRKTIKTIKQEPRITTVSSAITMSDVINQKIQH